MFSGWTAVVTGGGTGIGLMAAQALANNGARVYISGRRQEVLEQTVKTQGANLAHPQGQIIPIVADITSKSDVLNFVHEVSKREKRLDLLVNNAGISEGKSSTEKGQESAQALADELWKEDVTQWENVYRTNVIAYVQSSVNIHASPISFSHVFTTVAFLPLLSAASDVSSAIPSRTASVINISSMSGITRTSQHHIKYNVSKAASIHLNTLLAQELRQKGVKVRVNRFVYTTLLRSPALIRDPVSHRASSLQR